MGGRCGRWLPLGLYCFPDLLMELTWADGYPSSQWSFPGLRNLHLKGWNPWWLWYSCLLLQQKMFHSGIVTQSPNSYSTAVLWWEVCWWCPGTSMKLTSEWWWQSIEVKWYWISISCQSRRPILELMLCLVYVLWVAISEHCRHYWDVLYPGETWLL